jgi:hypothetical protein
MKNQLKLIISLRYVFFQRNFKKFRFTPHYTVFRPKFTVSIIFWLARDCCPDHNPRAAAALTSPVLSTVHPTMKAGAGGSAGVEGSFDKQVDGAVAGLQVVVYVANAVNLELRSTGELLQGMRSKA